MTGDDRKHPPRREPIPAEWEKLAEPLRKLARENPEITAGLLQGGIEAYGGAAEREMMRQEMLRRRQQQENLAALLMPMYAQYYGIGG